jgi:hypothetical protein
VYADHYDPRDRRPGYYSFILSAADHFLGVNGSESYPNTWPDYRPTGLAQSRNWEEVSVRRDLDLYTVRTNVAFPTYPFQLVDTAPQTDFEERGWKISFRRINRILPPSLQLRARWVWKRSYVLLANARNKHQCDYVYDWVIPNRLNQCPQGLASWSTYGFGCGLSPLLYVALNNPVLGSTWSAQLSNMPQVFGLQGVGLQIFGFSNYSGTGFDLALLGMPLCFLYATLDLTQVVIGTGGIAVSNLPLPSSPSLVGFNLYTTAAALSPENGFGWITSNGLALTLGF